MYMAKCSDELWVGVICQTNPEIAGSPRSVLRYSLGRSLTEVEHWMDSGENILPTPTKLRMPLAYSPGVRLRRISVVVERETAQTIS